MGVTGLWRLVEPAGKPVPVETLENKVLAVDISIWLHQMVKGYQDAKGAPLPNAHLMGLFQRLCKLLYFRIKPVFVFDGGFPELKKETIARRQDNKAKYNSESERIKRELALLLSKKSAVSSLLGKQISPSKQNSTSNNDDLFKLPALPAREESESDSEEERNSSSSSIDLHTVDLDSDNFKRLPTKEKYDILLDLKETRKQNSWGRLEELPKQSDNFSDFQMQRLLKRRKVQECLEDTEKEMGDTGMSLNDLECLLNQEGIDTKIETLPTKRIASNVTSRFLLIKDIKKAISDAQRKQDHEDNKPGPSNVTIKEFNEQEEKTNKVDELEDDLQKAIKMSLECVDDPNSVSKTDESWTSCMTDTDSASYGTDSEEEDGFEQPDMSCAKAYIMQYSDFTHRAINEIVTEKRKGKSKQKIPKVDTIIEEINKEKSVILDNVELSSSDDDSVEEVLQSEGVNDVVADAESDDSKKADDNLDEDSVRKETDNNLDITQGSIVCIEGTVPDIVNLDSSLEDMEEFKKQTENVKVKIEPTQSGCDSNDMRFSNGNETDSSDNDFEEVPSMEDKCVVQLTLKMDDDLEDDIFADVFTDNKKTIATVNTNAVNNTVDESKSHKVEDLQGTMQVLASKNVGQNIVVSGNICSTERNVAAIEDDSRKMHIHHDLSKNSQHLPTETKDKSINDSILADKAKDNKILNHNKSVLPTNNEKSIAKEVLTTEKLNTMVEEIENQEQDLLQEKGRLDRVGRNITEQMTKEAQELLQIFGIPYIVAPMEAEAQCAFLETAKLTDGTITDDSDIWLFGGKTVYKNFFNQKKHVLQFQADRIEKSFNLTREQLVLLALLVGSDYTTGLTGVGPVTAMEILASFPYNTRQVHNEATKQAQYAQIIKGLQEFKLWVKAGKRTDNTSLKKKLKNVSLNEDFPSIRVVQAYLEPNVEKNEDKFTWGELDITILRDYTKAKFGWSQNKLDEIIKPVLKRLIERKTQRSMQDFFKRKIDFQSLEDQMSKRVKAAVQRMGPGNKDRVEGLDGETVTTDKKIKVATKRKAAKPGVRSKTAASVSKQKKDDETSVLLHQGVKVVSAVKDNVKSEYEVNIPKTGNYQEIIPQREKDKRNLLENKLKAIEVFRKTQIDKKRKHVKRKALKPKENADLSESDSD